MPTASGKPSMMDMIREGQVPSFFSQRDFEPYFCMGTGQHIRSKEHRRQIIRERNLIEVGNEIPPEIKKHMELEQTQKKENYDEK